MSEFEKIDDLKRDATSFMANGQLANQIVPEPKAGANSAERLIGETIDGRYQLISMIGEGGMGRVYKAKQILTGRIVAMKMLPARNTSDMTHMMRFQQEAKAACAINHPSAVSVYAFGITSDGIPYIAMQFVDGTTLADEIARRKSISEPFALQIFEEMADALDCAHEQRVLHRDIKPSNIMLVPDKKIGLKAMLLDFGIAKIEDEAQAQLNITKTGEVFGTPLYMSPEQCQGKKLDNRADIYSLGCVMYEALTGSPPFTGENFLQIVHRHVHDPLVPVASVQTRKPISGALQDIVSKCLEKDPADRFQSMAQLRSALENADKRTVPAQESAAGKRMMAALLILISVIVLVVVWAIAYPSFKQVPHLQNKPATIESRTTTPISWTDVYTQATSALDEGRWQDAQKLFDESYYMTNTNQMSRASLTSQLEKDGLARRKDVVARIEQARPLLKQDKSLNPNLAPLRAQCLNQAQAAEILFNEALICLRGSQKNAIEQQKYQLAQLYQDRSEIWDTPADEKIKLEESAEQLYATMENPSDPYVLHQYGTLLIFKCLVLNKLSSKASSHEAEKMQKQADECYAKAIVELKKCADMCLKLAKKGGRDQHDDLQLAADSHLWIGNAYVDWRRYREADKEYDIAGKFWQDNLAPLYSYHARNLRFWLADAENKPNKKEAESLRARADKLEEMANKTK